MNEALTTQSIQIAAAHHRAGRLAEARAIYQQILAREPNHPDALHLLGVMAIQSGQTDAAIELIRRAIAINPGAADYHNNLGYALRNKGDLEGSIVAWREAIRLRPDFAEAYNNLGIALRDKGQLDEAILACRQAIRIKPDSAQAYNNLGAALSAKGSFDEAIAVYRQALQFNPDLAEIHSNLGNALRGKTQYDESLASSQQAVRLSPNFAEGHMNLGVILCEMGRFDEAIAACRTALRLKPDFAQAHDDLLYCLYFHPDCDDEKIFQELMRWERQHARPLRGSIRPHRNDPNPARRLKIGYVSPDFFGQAESFFVVPLMESHGHEQFEIHCYSSVVQPDGVTAHLRRCADAWHDVGSLSDEALAEQIRRDQIDILVDLTMHMARSRMLVFARKPAPVQVTWLAYPGSTGLATVDYRLTDARFDPPGRISWYSEESYRLPDGWCCYSPLGFSQPVKADRGGPICFGSLNNPRKLNEPILRLWARVLRRVEGSRLLVLSMARDQRQLITRIFGEAGIGADRITFAENRVRLEYLRLYDQIDVVLDTVPYNGITTTCDALWMGVPVVSLAGKTAAGRAGLSLLSTVGLPVLVAEDGERFVEIAAGLALDRQRLVELRTGLRQRMESSPLMDGKRFARNVESAYRWMWQRWCEKAADEVRPGTANSEKVRINEGPATQPIQIAAAHHQAGRLAEARTICQQILAQEPRHPDALHLLGAITLQLGQTDAAIDLIRRAIAINPGVVDYYNDLGYALRNKGQLDEALRAWRQATALRPDFAEAHNNVGIALREKGQIDQAIVACREALRLNPKYAQAYNNLGINLNDQGRHDEAVAACREGLRLWPNSAEISTNLGNALSGQGKFDEAIAAYQEALRFKPEYALAHNNLGNALRSKGQLNESIESYRQTIRLAPDYADAYMNLGTGLLNKSRLPEVAAPEREGLFDEAIRAFRNAIRLKPDAPDWHFRLAAATGDSSIKKAPAQYVRGLFDSYARTFDEHLVQTLKYQAPKLLLQSVLAATQRRDLDVLDLGCGTGLCGVEFRPYARRLVGVDLSPVMLRAAKSREVYDELNLGDLMSALRAPGNGYDLILAGDVLIYVGDLTDVMPAVAQALKSGGLFACSIEDYDGRGFFLHSDVRFAHSIGYFRERAAASGLREISANKVVLRQNKAVDVPGWILVVGKP